MLAEQLKRVRAAQPAHEGAATIMAQGRDWTAGEHPRLSKQHNQRGRVLTAMDRPREDWPAGTVGSPPPEPALISSRDAPWHPVGGGARCKRIARSRATPSRGQHSSSQRWRACARDKPLAARRGHGPAVGRRPQRSGRRPFSQGRASLDLENNREQGPRTGRPSGTQMQTADVGTSAMALLIEAGQSVVLQLCHTVARSADKIQLVQETDAMTSDRWGQASLERH